MSASTNPVQVIDARPRVRYAIPAPPSPEQLVGQSRAAWHPPGRPVTVAGRTIPDGMVYVGSNLESVSGRRNADPALIDPSLPVARSNPDTSGIYLSYWPSYTELRPESRAGYLDWLAAGRPAGAPIGYVFLFFYGLERRVLFDARHDSSARAEIPVLIQQVERLKRLYPDQRSFQGYTSEFLVAALVMKGEVDPREIEPPMPDGSWELPLAAQVALGTFAANRQPIPPIWALSWLRCDPETRLRTPAKRCNQEFTTLFRIAYQRQYGEGMIVDPPKRTLELVYRPASAGFSGPVALGKRALPDVSQLRKPQSQLRAIAELVTAQLDEYSRALGNGRPGASPSALAFLPNELGDIARFPSVAPLAVFLAGSLHGQEIGMVEVARLLHHFPELGARPSQKQSVAISRLVERLGYGLEPDPATHRKAFVDSMHVGLYRLDGDHTLPARNLDGATGMLGLCSLVARADGTITSGEERAIFGQVERAYGLSPLEARRIRAHLAWLGHRPATLNDARKRLAQLTPQQAQQTGRFLVTVAGIDGRVAPDEVRVLGRLYQAMGLSDQQLHSDLHQLTARPGPVRVIDAAPPAQHRIPPFTVPPGRLELDPAYLRLVQQQTAEIAGVLDSVFAGDTGPVATAEPDIAPPSDDPTPDGADPYRELIELLSGRPTWEMTELSAMARSLGLMASGAIETINDRAAVMGLDPLLDCDGEICDVNAPALDGLLARA
ncbi:MAG TPA: TerB N-terminal domain-containing protein [Thermomicrobiales bacterium]|nr:TerB N-terminal domain-containing protein [Thermomicrobiales bacterium]